MRMKATTRTECSGRGSIQGQVEALAYPKQSIIQQVAGKSPGDTMSPGSPVVCCHIAAMKVRNQTESDGIKRKEKEDSTIWEHS